MTKFRIWLLASRPKTLLAAFVPVTVGASLAYHEQQIHYQATLAALICSILIQIGTNFTNDLFDFIKGADNSERIGPTRVLNAGLVSEEQMKLAIWLTFGSAFLIGLYLVYLGGPIILIIGILSIIAGIAYTAGPFPLAYNGLGDVFSFVFFGIVGTVGTYYINTGEFSIEALLASLPVGALVTAILVVNNYRDVDQDQIAGKRTLAVIFGKQFARFEYLLLLTIAYVIPLLLVLNYNLDGWLLLPYLTLPVAVRLIKMLFINSGVQLNKTLELTAKFSALYGLLLSIGFIL